MASSPASFPPKSSAASASALPDAHMINALSWLVLLPSVLPQTAMCTLAGPGAFRCLRTMEGTVAAALRHRAEAAR